VPDAASVADHLRRYYDDEVQTRAARPLGDERERCLAAFVAECSRREVQSVIEVGCGAGRDGVVIAGAGIAYAGVDLSPGMVEHCRSLGLDAQVAVATSLPFPDDSFDAAWTMSTLMHLPGDDLILALAELRRVVRPGGLVEIGIWGATVDAERQFGGGRYVHLRTDEAVLDLLATHGHVDAFDTWDAHDDDLHYQWARLTTPL
jgi:SAM-dependent methyltransferase